MKPAEPARIHLLRAAEAPVVVVLRRKPSRVFHVISLDTVTGKWEVGSRFVGKLYPMRCDVSFDGKWLVYLAMGANGETWNGVSQVPRLTAVAQGGNMGTYYGGGYWRARDVLCLNRWDVTPNLLPFRTEQLQVGYGAEDFSVLFPRLGRDGWHRRGPSFGRHTEVKGAKKFTVLCEGDDGWEQSFSQKHPPLIAWNAGYLAHGHTFRFRVPSDPELLDDEVSWATYDARGQLVVARKGVVTIHRKRTRERFELVHRLDFEAELPELEELPKRSQ